MDLPASLEVLQPSERLVFVQACGSRDHRSRERAGHLAQCRSHAIPTRLGLALLELAASAAGQRTHPAERARVRAYVLPAGRHRSELGSCRTTPPAHVRTGGPPQTDAIRAPSDRRRNDARRAPSRSSPHRPLALDSHHRKPLGHRRRVAELRRVSSRAARPVRPRLQRQADRHH